MASYQAEEATDVTGPTHEASQQSAAANPVGVLQANFQAAIRDFMSQRPSADELYNAHAMLSELAHEAYGRYQQELWQNQEAVQQQAHDEWTQQAFDRIEHADHSQRQEAGQQQAHDEWTQQAFDEIEHADHSQRQEPGIEDSVAQGTPTSDPNEEFMVPDAVFIAESDQPYNPSWMEKWNIAPQILQNLRSRMKFEELCRRGVLMLDHDVLHFTSWNGQAVERRLVVTNRVMNGQPNVKLLREPFGNPWDPEPRECCWSLKEILEFVKRCTKDSPTYKNLGYSDVSVTRGGAEIGTLHDIRLRYHVWQVYKDQYMARTGMRWRKRRIDKKTGTGLVSVVL
ncbi:MAG: hypothetical protein Q9202_001828 [Teloschistes flavicans]